MQGQVIRLSGRSSVGNARRRGARSISQRELYGDRGASIEVRSRATCIADDIELSVSPDLRDVDHTVFGAQRESSGSIAENRYVIATRRGGPGERQFAEGGNGHIGRVCESAVDDTIALTITLKRGWAVQGAEVDEPGLYENRRLALDGEIGCVNVLLPDGTAIMAPTCGRGSREVGIDLK